MAKLPTAFASAGEIETSFLAAGASPDEAKAIAAGALPAISLTCTPFNEDDGHELHLGGTRIGGLPDLPALMEWPWRPAYPDAAKRIAESKAVFEALEPADLEAMQTVMLEEAKKHLTAEQVAELAAEAAKVDLSAVEFSDLGDEALRVGEAGPLSFIAQIDLAEMWSVGQLDPDVPHEGRLWLFFDADQMPVGYRPTDAVGARLIYDTSPIDALEPCLPPEELEDIGLGLFPTQVCALRAGWYPPYPGSTPIASCRLGQPAERVLRRWWSEAAQDENDSRLGGHPTQLEGDMAIQSVLVAGGHNVGAAAPVDPGLVASAMPAAEDWVFLMQVATIDTADMMWGDLGKLYVWIPRASLKDRRFDDARVILQMQ